MIPSKMKTVDKQHKIGGRPRLLVSVRNASEAAAALAGGANWIDLKEPLAGPLGAVEVETARDVVATVAGRRPLSAALGELWNWPTPGARQLLKISEIAVVKLGLSRCAGEKQWKRRWCEAAAEVAAAGKQLAAVAYADWQQAQAPRPLLVASQAAIVRSRYLLLDTFEKRGGSLPAHFPEDKLGEILHLAREAGLQTAVAGRLMTETLAALPNSAIDFVAVRGGVCEGQRTSQIRQELVEQFRKAIDERWPSKVS
ncbi:MAG: (5-formylfuran-3-yl)methyl phosphate synthase [Pirellulales bacterium]|nr:(5-formylfuran-3-yl)methyl phosphate synthase [Pirellulales bacterium]